MPDVFSKRKRSEVMARIRSRGNRDTELALVRLLRAQRISGWRRHIRVRSMACGTRNLGAGAMAGRSFRTPRSALRVFTVRPDFVFLKQRVTVFVDGCFWHGCPRHATQPQNNAVFWRRKLAANRARDRRVNRELRRAGWRVVRIWEHELKRGAQNAKRGIPPVGRRILRALGAEPPPVTTGS
jgi:DNA mismatch endonuclease (patch repair protein)